MRQCGIKTECIVAFPLQQWLHEGATVLRYTHIVCIVFRVVYSPTVHELWTCRFHSAVRE
jgi:hypothetical protein